MARMEDWEIATRMHEVWVEHGRLATGSPRQREIWRMVAVLKWVREFYLKEEKE